TAPHRFRFTAPWESTVPITASIPCQLWLSRLTHQRTEQPWGSPETWITEQWVDAEFHDGKLVAVLFGEETSD
ncbi:MAG: hypothetical protein WCA81_15155, partial [Rhizomicrobium sp.]